MDALNGWENFYVIVGSSAGALIGLQFVVLTLIAGRPALDMEAAGAAFATPTIVHFGTALLLSAIGCAPWGGVSIAALAWGLVGIIGIVYVVVVARRMRSQTFYRPEFEDWLFHLILPLVAYAMLGLSPLLPQTFARETLFGVAAASLLLLFIGIHNAWDAVTYHLFSARREVKEEDR